MFDSWLKSRFYSKCQSNIKVMRMRIEMIKRRRNAMVKYLRNDIADLLRNGFDSIAYSRVEGLYLEHIRSSCYDHVDQFAMIISTHLSDMDKQKECPEECREAIPSLMFAAAWFADLPELRELRSLFFEKYGYSLEPFINKEFVNKLKGERPTKETKLQLMQEIALESDIMWDPKALQPNYKPSALNQDRSQNGNQDTNHEPPKNRRQNSWITYVQETEYKQGNDCTEVANRPPHGLSISASEVEKKNDYHTCGRVLSYLSTRNSRSRENSPSAEENSSEDAVKRRRFFGFRLAALPYIKKNLSKMGTTWKPSPGSNENRPVSKPNPEFANDQIRYHDEERATDAPFDSEALDTGNRSRRESGSMKREKSLSAEEQTSNPPAGHVHPKLPDYDELVTRLASLRASS